MTAPSRRDNPFATCWVHPHTAPVCVVDQQTLEGLLARLRLPGASGAIIGPHGSGKTTLARRIADLLLEEGWQVDWSELHDGKRSQSDLAPARRGVPVKALQVVDGYEQLNCWQRWKVRRRCRRSGVSLLVTSHDATSLPTLIQLEPQLDVALSIFHRLTAQIPTPVTPEDVTRGYEACRGNLRDLWFHLYDLHELRNVGTQRRLHSSDRSP